MASIAPVVYSCMVEEEQTEQSETKQKPDTLNRAIYITAFVRAWLKRTIFRTWVHVAAILGIVVVSLLTFLLWSEFQQRFPALPEGAYYGILEGVFSADSKIEKNLYAENIEQEGKLLLTLLEEGWAPQKIDIAGSRISVNDKDWLYPLILSNSRNSIRLIGSRISSGEYRGTATNLGSGLKGRWALHKVKVGIQALTEEEKKELQLWLLLRNELNEIEHKVSRFEEIVPKQKGEITRLEEFVTEGSELKSRADEKLKLALNELDQARKKLKQEQDEIAELESKVLIAQKVTKKGKLVQLARKSLEREARWVESMLNTSIVNESPKLKEALKRAEEILELKKSIAIEKDRIVQLHSKRGR